MDFYGVLFGIWFGIGTYRLFEMLEFDRMNETDPEEEYGMGPSLYFFLSLVSAYGWPITMPYAYMTDDGEDG